MKKKKFDFLENRLDNHTTLEIINKIKNGNFSQRELNELSQKIWLKLEKSKEELIEMRAKI